MPKIIFALVALLLAVHFACRKPVLGREVKYVAFVGFNYEDPHKARRNNFSDSLHILALEEYLQRINASEKPAYPYEYRLLTFQCDYKEDTIRQIYSSILADTNIALVVDNTWGRHIRHARDLIRDQLPV
ncbi:MAG: hypothetical protein L6Q97_26510, partial [Thermoanaerobaculia bacterium]|nr:hypothetical protein [Thermoanaerobaculia bacterium]